MKTEINLLPIQIHKKKRKKFSKKNPFLSIVLGTLALCLIIYGILSVMNQNRSEEIKQVEEVIKNQSGFRIPYENLTAQNEILVHREKLLEVMNLNKEMPLKVLVGVQDAVPSGTEIVDYQLKENVLILTGNTRNQEEILAFRKDLMGLGLFKNVIIQNTIKKQVVQGAGNDVIGVSNKENVWDFIFEIELLGVEAS
ncbi:hypothetical protein [Acetobacterium sp.]|uniref:hypothetical protein n=1 Tax=Acetobacterium sp. TaxID=1872094 RepID=UPI002F3E5D91